MFIRSVIIVVMFIGVLMIIGIVVVVVFVIMMVGPVTILIVGVMRVVMVATVAIGRAITGWVTVKRLIIVRKILQGQVTLLVVQQLVGCELIQIDKDTRSIWMSGIACNWSDIAGGRSRTSQSLMDHEGSQNGRWEMAVGGSWSRIGGETRCSGVPRGGWSWRINGVIIGCSGRRREMLAETSNKSVKKGG